MKSCHVLRSAEAYNQVISTFGASGKKIGTETEYLATFADGTPLTETQAATLAQKLDKAGFKYSREIFAGVFEIKTPPFKTSNISKLFNTHAEDFRKLNTFLSKEGYQLHDLPFDSQMTLDEALNYRISHPRADGLFSHLRKCGKDDIVKHSVMTTGVHVSVGFDTMDQALKLGSLATKLTPLLTLLMENNNGLSEGQNYKGNVMGHRRHAQGPRTDIQDYFITSHNGTEFLQRHLDHICTVPAMMYLDQDNNAQVFKDPDNDNLASLSQTQDITADNFFLVEKMQYNDVKLASIRDANDKVTGHRIELRMADRGSHQLDSMTLVALMLSDKDGQTRLQSLLEKYGYGGSDQKTHQRVQSDLMRAIYHNGHFLKQTMTNGFAFSDMAKDFGIELSAFLQKKHPQLLTKAAPLTQICQRGISEAEQKTYQRKKGCSL